MQRNPFLSRQSRRALVQSAALLAALVTTACVELPPTPKPDYAVRVRTQNGKSTAIPPQCASWNTDITDPFDNQPLPQFGCATARNLALMIERPEDLVEGRPLGTPDSVTSLGAILRYRNNQSRGLIWTGTDPNSVATTTASTPASSLTGEVAAVPRSSSAKSGP